MLKKRLGTTDFLLWLKRKPQTSKTSNFSGRINITSDCLIHFKNCAMTQHVEEQLMVSRDVQLQFYYAYSCILLNEVFALK